MTQSEPENPFDFIVPVLKENLSGDMSPRVSSDNGRMYPCLYSPGPFWRREAEMVVKGLPLMGAQDAVIKKVVLPLLQAQKIMEKDTITSRDYTDCLRILDSCWSNFWSEPAKAYVLWRRKEAGK